MLTTEAIPVIVVTGTVGVGKSTVMRALSEALEGRGVRHAAIDQDYLRWVYPAPEGDRFGGQLGLRNLAAIWPNLRELRLTCVLIADVVENMASCRAAYVTAMPGTAVTVVRLTGSLPLILRRLEGRESGDSLAWSQQRAPELHGIQEREGVGDVVIDVGERSPEEVAEEIIRTLGFA